MYIFDVGTEAIRNRFVLLYSKIPGIYPKFQFFHTLAPNAFYKFSYVIKYNTIQSKNN